MKEELGKKKVATVLVTVANLKGWAEALAKVSTNGAFFVVTKGEHLTSDDMFKAAEVPARKDCRFEERK